MTLPELNDDQKMVIAKLMAEGMRVERERILAEINKLGSKTISISKLSKIIGG